MAKIPIGLQLYSVRKDCEADLPKVLAAVKQMGYDGVDFAGYYGRSATEMRQLLDDHGLICCGAHVQWGDLQPDKIGATSEFHQILKNPYLVVPGLPKSCTESKDAWLRTAEQFCQIADTLRPLHQWTGYHNHHTEFGQLDGARPWDVFFGNTPGDVIMQLDMGNALAGGGEAVPILKQYPGRAITVHLKPYCTDAGKDDMHAGFKPLIGEDSVPWAEVFGLCETIGGTRWYIVEYESDKYPPLEAVDKCLQALRGMGK